MKARSRSSRSSLHPNSPPQDEPWFWFTHAMLESESWSAMPLSARRVVERVILENMAHGGTQNGDLAVTYDDFAHFGLSSRRATAAAIRVAEALGFLDITVQGRRAYGGRRVPSRYGLTWLPRCDRTPASNRWRQIATRAEAKRLAHAAATSTKPPGKARFITDPAPAAAAYRR